MSYFVTGATGFIGRNLVEALLERDGTVYVLVREGSRGRLEELRRRWSAGPERVVPIVGDLAQPGLGVSDSDRGLCPCSLRASDKLAPMSHDTCVAWSTTSSTWRRSTT